MIIFNNILSVRCRIDKTAIRNAGRQIKTIKIIQVRNDGALDHREVMEIQRRR